MYVTLTGIFQTSRAEPKTSSKPPKMLTARHVAAALPGSDGDCAYVVGPVKPGFCPCCACRKHAPHWLPDVSDRCSCYDAVEV